VSRSPRRAATFVGLPARQLARLGDWWKRKFERMDKAAHQRYRHLKIEEEVRRHQAQDDDRFRGLEQQIQELKKKPPGRPKLKIREIIEAAAVPLIEAGEKKLTAKLLDVWKNSPRQGEPKTKKDLATRKRQIRNWTKPFRDEAAKKTEAD
jgi:hypothetical protein